MKLYWLKNKVVGNLDINEKNDTVTIQEGSKEVSIRMKHGKYDVNINQTFLDLVVQMNKKLKEEELETVARVGGISTGIQKELFIVIESKSYLKIGGSLVKHLGGIELLNIVEEYTNDNSVRFDIEILEDETEVTVEYINHISKNTEKTLVFTKNEDGVWVSKDGKVEIKEKDGFISFVDRGLKHSTIYTYKIKKKKENTEMKVSKRTSGDGYYVNREFIKYKEENIKNLKSKRLDVSQDGNFLLLAETKEVSPNSEDTMILYLYDVKKKKKTNIDEVKIVKNLQEFETFGFGSSKDGHSNYFYIDKDFKFVFKNTSDSSSRLSEDYKNEGLDVSGSLSMMNLDFLKKGFYMDSDCVNLYYVGRNNKSIVEVSPTDVKRMNFIGFDGKDIRKVKILSKVEGKRIFTIQIFEKIGDKIVSQVKVVDFEDYQLSNLQVKEDSLTEVLEEANIEEMTMLLDRKGFTVIKGGSNIISFSMFYDILNDQLEDGEELVLEEVEQQYETTFKGLNDKHNTILMILYKDNSGYSKYEFIGLEDSSQDVQAVLRNSKESLEVLVREEVELDDSFIKVSNVLKVYKEGNEDGSTRAKNIISDVLTAKMSTKGLLWSLNKSLILFRMNTDYELGVD